jgi:predicted DNA repair protein MutK
VSADDDAVQIAGNSFTVCFNSVLSQKVLSNLYKLGKPYVSFEGEEKQVEVIKPKFKIKKKKAIINEPKKESKADNNPNEEES